MLGASHLKCMQDGSWNGTEPLCLRKLVAFANSNLKLGYLLLKIN